MKSWIKNLTTFQKTFSTLVLIVIIAAMTWAFTHYPSPAVLDLTYTQASQPTTDTMPLRINFVNRDGQPTSVAPLHLINKDARAGIKLTPSIKGTWHWNNAHLLQFTPKQTWPAGTNLTVKFTNIAFNKTTQLENNAISVKTPPLHLTITDYKFYINPKNPQQKYLTATVNSNYALSETALNKYTQLFLQGLNSKTKIPFNIALANHSKTIYLKSQSLAVPKTDSFAFLVINKDMPVISGGKNLRKLQQSVKIASLTNLLKINSTDSKIINNTNNDPIQLLQVNSNIAVSQSSLEKHIQTYLLPQYANPQKKLFWQRVGQVTPQILKSAPKVKLTALTSNLNSSPVQLFTYKSTPSRQIYLVISPGMKAIGGYKLGQDYRALMTIPSYPKTLQFMRQGALMDPEDSRNISVETRGIKAVKFTVSKILPNDLNQFITQTYGDLDNTKLLSKYSFNYSNMSDVYQNIIPLNTEDTQGLQYPTLHLKQYYKHNQLGLFHIQVSGWDTKNNYSTTNPIQRVILMTNMSLISKRNHDGSQNVYALNIRTNKPVAHAHISVLAKNGLSVYSTQTNLEGIAKIPNLNNSGQDQNTPIAIIAKYQGDVSFLKTSNSPHILNTSSFNVGGISVPTSNPINAYAFSDRGLYRPGDIVHIAAIIKNSNWILGKTKNLTGVPITIAIYDPQGHKVLNNKVALSETGLEAIDFHTTKQSLPGTYTAYFYIPNTNNKRYTYNIGEVYFHVRNFQPATMSLTANFKHIKNTAWLQPQMLTAHVHLKNLFGSPADHLKVSTKLTITAGNFTVPSYAGYKFYDPLTPQTKLTQPYHETLDNAFTNQLGDVDITPQLTQFNQATYWLTLAVKAYPPAGGKTLETSLRTLISPLSAIIGTKADGSLDFIREHAKRSIRYIAINNKQQTIPLNNLIVTLSKITQIMSLVEKPNGTYQYELTDKTTHINSHPFTISTTGTNLPLTTQSAGHYLLTITNNDNQTISKLKFTVVGKGEHFLNRNAKLAIKLNKAVYHAGDTIKVALNAPYPGSGLISLESNHVVSQHWFHSKNSSAVESIKIPNNFNGNGYVSVMWFKPFYNKQRHLNPLSYAIAPFAVTHKKQTISIHLETPKEIISGHKLTIKYTTSKPSKIIVYAVDQGILQLARYQLPQPLQYYFKKRMLQVDTLQNTSLVMPYYRAPGGGMSQHKSASIIADTTHAINQSLNPFSQQLQRPVVMWSGILNTNSTPRSLHFKIPNYFNGTLKIMAVAVNSDAMGSTETAVLAHNHFVIQPNTPSFVAPNDQFTIGVTIHNALKHSQAHTPITLKLETSAFSSVGETIKHFDLTPKGDKTLFFTLKAKPQLGADKLTFLVSGADVKSQLSQNISVRPATLYTTHLINGTSSHSKKISIKHQFYSQKQLLQASIATTPRIFIEGLKKSIATDNSDSTNQLVNQLLTSITTSYDKTQKIVSQIIARQNTDGGFNTWSQQSNTSNPQTSLYVIDAFTQAQQAGVSIPNNALEQALTYLKQVTSSTIYTMQQANINAYAIYLLTRNQIVASNRLAKLELYLQQQPSKHWKTQLIAAYMAGAFQQMKSFDHAKELLSQYDPNKNSIASNAQYDLILASSFPQRFSESADENIHRLTAAISSTSLQNQAAARSIIALNDYAAMSANPPTLLNIATKSSTQSNYEAPAHETTTQLTRLIPPEVQSIKLNSSDTTPFYYQVILAGYPNTLNSKPQGNQLQIYSEIDDQNNNPINKIKLGQVATVTIRLQALSQQATKPTLITSLLPGGFSLIPNSASCWPSIIDPQNDRILFVVDPSAETQTLSYKIRATVPGNFTVPPTYARALDNHNLFAKSLAQQIIVTR
jgi:uncharacterized protein YfaS (alpha-2-macroglobulin family)